MFYISLPYFYENYKFNSFFKDYIQNSHKYRLNKLIDQFNIEYSYGSFPWLHWNGGNNNHQGKAALVDEMQYILYNSNIPIRLDVSNIYLNEKDYNDIHANSILRIANGTNIIYEASLLDLMSYISAQTLNNKFIISNNAQILSIFDESIINTFIDEDTIDLINIGSHINYDLNKISDKNKLEITIGHCQKCDHNTQLTCSCKEQQNIYNYSGQSIYLNCYNEYISNNYYDDIKPYLNKGIKHFKLMANLSNLNDFNIAVIKSFIKPEYIGECINEYYKYIIK